MCVINDPSKEVKVRFMRKSGQYILPSKKLEKWFSKSAIFHRCSTPSIDNRMRYSADAIDINPSYTKLFWTHTLYQGGGGGGGERRAPGHPTISPTLGCTNVKLCKVLEIPFRVSENTRFVKNLLHGYHGNCLITWCFSLIIVKMIMKNR